MNLERGLDLEEIKRQEEQKRVVAMMREHGLESNEASRCITEWALREEQRIPRNMWGIGEQTRIDSLQADMMAQAGYIGEAIEFLEPLLDIAAQEGRDDLVQKIEAKIQELQSKLQT